jgi:hypothetical protein
LINFADIKPSMSGEIINWSEYSNVSRIDDFIFLKLPL